MSYTITLLQESADFLMDYLQDYSVAHTNNYTLFRAKYKGAVLTIYKTYTLLIQGSEANLVYQEMCNLLKITPVTQSKQQLVDINLSIIGTDEVGTGDFFGPIIVAAAFVDKSKILTLMRLGIRDSKELSDHKIKEIAPEIMKEISYHIVSLDNLKYNYLVKKCNYNMNKIKALLHNSAIKKILTKVNNYDAIIIDGFTTKDKYLEYIKSDGEVVENVELVEKGESKYAAIACASIIARYAFLIQLDKLSKEIGFDLPKGAGPKIDLAISKFLKEHPLKLLDKYGKTNFKNMEKFTS